MEDISVVVKQEIGSITWNFDEIKERLSSELAVFKKTVYTDDTIKSAKTDLASLRKLSKDVEDRRKEIKNKCLEPYEQIEEQAKELVKLINEPINAINSQVEDYEKRRKEAVRKKIEEYWQKQADKLPEELREKAHKKIYDSRWENATATMKSWKDGIDSGINSILKDIETIQSFHSDFEEDMMQVYKINLDLQPAILRMNELNAQRERVLEQERKKEEERKAREEAARKAAEEHEAANVMASEAAEAVDHKEAVQPIEESKQENITSAPTETPHEPVGGQEREVLTVIGTRQQIEKIKAFIKYSGADWKAGAVWN